MKGQASNLKIILAYFAIAVAVLLIAFFFPRQDESLASVPVLVSLFLLIPLYAGYRSYAHARAAKQEA